MRQAGILTGDVSLHTLRHTALSRIINAGIDDYTVMAISGHSSTRMLERYTKNERAEGGRLETIQGTDGQKRGRTAGGGLKKCWWTPATGFASNAQRFRAASRLGCCHADKCFRDSRATEESVSPDSRHSVTQDLFGEPNVRQLEPNRRIASTN